MSNLSDALSNLDLDSTAKEVITKILSKLEAKSISSFIEHLQIKNRKVAGTCHAEVKPYISRAEFVSLYEALGYNFKSEVIWDDRGCVNGSCVYMKTFTCNPDLCGFHVAPEK